jgi:hypothetical protein
MDKRTAKIGYLQTVTRTLALADTVSAASKWTFGKQTVYLKRTHPTPAPSTSTPDVKAFNAATIPMIGTKESAIKMVAISTRTG